MERMSSCCILHVVENEKHMLWECGHVSPMLSNMCSQHFALSDISSKQAWLMTWKLCIFGDDIPPHLCSCNKFWHMMRGAWRGSNWISLQ